MAISKEKKRELVAQYEEALRSSEAVIFTEYRGLTTPELGKLRAAVREADGAYSVVKLTLFGRALENAGVPAPEGVLSGPVAVGFCHRDVPAVAKAIRNFGKEHELLTVTGGVMGNRVLSVAEVEAIADLPPVEVIRARLIGLIGGPARNLASTIAAGVRQVVNVLNAYSESERGAQAASAEA